MGVRFRQNTHAEMVRSSEGSLFRKYQNVANNLQSNDDVAVMLSQFISEIVVDKEIDEALRRAKLSIEAGKGVRIAADLSSVPFAILDRFQRESNCADDVNEVLRDRKVEGFVGVLPMLLQATIRSAMARFDKHIEIVTITRLFVNALAHAGEKVFVLSDDLAWALRETELRKYPAEDLRLPHKTIYIEVPGDYRVFNRDTGWHHVIGCYVSESEFEDRRRWRLLMVGESKDKNNEHDDALFFFAVDLMSGKTVEDCLKDCRATHRELNGLGRAGVPPELFNEVEDENEKLFRLIMNVVLYITNHDADAVFADASPEYRALKDRLRKAQGSKRERIKAQMRHVASRPRIVLGGSLVVDRHQDELEGIEGLYGAISGGRHWKVRTLVRGHWRSQPCGAGNKDRRPTWIRPHWAGPQQAQVTSKVTEVR